MPGNGRWWSTGRRVVLVETLVHRAAGTNASTVTDPHPGALSANQPRLSGSGDSPREAPADLVERSQPTTLPTPQPATGQLLIVNWQPTPCPALLLGRPSTSTRTH